MGYNGLRDLLAFVRMAFMCSWNLRSLEKVNPRCLCVFVMGIGSPPKVSFGDVLFGLWENVCCTVLESLNLMAHSCPYFLISSRSSCKEF